MSHETVSMDAKKIIGIEVRTSNQDGQAGVDIPKLWERFFMEGIKEKISNKVSEKTYACYTKYDGDHTEPYSLILGYEVSEVPSELPAGCVVHETAPSSSVHFPVEGELPQGIYETWVKVWGSDLNRVFTTDFEVYDESFNPANGDASGINLYIAIA